MNSDGPKPRDRLVGEFYRIMILSRSRNRYRDRDRARIVRHSDFDSDFDFDQEHAGKPMLFYPVKYHPPITASSVIRVIKPNLICSRIKVSDSRLRFWLFLPFVAVLM